MSINPSGLARYMNQLSYDDDLGYDDEDLGGPGAAARRMIRRRRAARCSHGDPQAWRRSYQVGADDDDLGADELDIGDDEELAGIDEEIESLEADDDEDLGGDSESLGASLRSIERREARLRALLTKLEAKLEATPTYRRAKRERLAKRIARVRNRLRKKEAKADMKREKLAAKLGIPAAALAAGVGGAAAMGVTPTDVAVAQAAMTQGQAQMASGLFGLGGVYNPPAGSLVEVPFLNTNDVPGFLVELSAGATTGDSASIAVQTPSISYADFDLHGLNVRCTITMGNASDVPPIVTCANWQISGGLNQIYYETTVTQNGGAVGQTGAGVLSYSKQLTSTRTHGSKLNRTNTGSATFNIYYLGSAATNGLISVVIEAALVLRVRTDDNMPGVGAGYR